MWKNFFTNNSYKKHQRKLKCVCDFTAASASINPTTWYGIEIAHGACFGASEFVWNLVSGAVEKRNEKLYCFRKASQRWHSTSLSQYRIETVSFFHIHSVHMLNGILALHCEHSQIDSNALFNTNFYPTMVMSVLVNANLSSATTTGNTTINQCT